MSALTDAHDMRQKIGVSITYSRTSLQNREVNFGVDMFPLYYLSGSVTIHNKTINAINFIMFLLLKNVANEN